ncbi:MAG: BA14K family protein [Bradyrhizobium sp.]
MQFSRMICTVVLAGATSLASLQGAAAAPLAVNAGIGNTMSNVETVQYRHGRPGWRHHGGWRHGGYGGRHRHYGYGNGAAVLGGLAAGAVIGGAIANSRASSDTEAYCSQRYKSYDPASGTYLGYDGGRHPCP